MSHEPLIQELREVAARYGTASPDTTRYRRAAEALAQAEASLAALRSMLQLRNQDLETALGDVAALRQQNERLREMHGLTILALRSAMRCGVEAKMVPALIEDITTNLEALASPETPGAP